jgi:hypothetical protein
MRAGLLIQGPLLSYGRTGANCMQPLGEATLVNFDCRETIRGIVSSYGHLFRQVVVSTWDDAVFPDFAVAQAELMRIPDAAPQVEDAKSRRARMARRRNREVPNNMLRQFFGTHQGLLRFHDVDQVVRIRTDQTLDLAALVGALADDDRIRVAYLTKEDNDLPDFYFAGRLAVMLDLFSTLSRPDCISLNPHHDIVLRYAREKYFREIGVDEGWYNDHPTSECSRIYAYMYNNVFAPLPRSAYESMIWRGEPFGWEHRQQFDGFCFDRPGFYSHRHALFRIEDALFRTRNGSFARFVQKALRRTIFVAARVYERTFR